MFLRQKQDLLKGCVIIVHDQAVSDAFGRLRVFRQGWHDCLTARDDALFELTDAVACRLGRVESVPGLSLEPEFRRGHGALYDGLTCGRVDETGLRGLLLETVPAGTDGLVWFAGDVSGWPRPDAATSPERVAMYDKTARTLSGHPVTSGWPFAVMAGLEWGPTSWTAPVDMARLGPADTLTGVTLAAIERVRVGLARGGRAEVAGFVFDAEYDLMALSHRVADRVHVVGRLRCNQRFHAEPEPEPGRRGRRRRHGEAIKLNEPGSLGVPDRAAVVDSPRYGRVRLSAWDGRHRRLQRQGFWAGHPGVLPIVTGSVIGVELERLPGGKGVPDGPMWLWHAGPTPLDVVTIFSAYQRRFDIEHTFRFVKQELGWTCPAPMRPETAQVWTWIVLVVYTQLRLARGVCRDVRLPWEKPVEPDRVPPGRVRRDFRRICAMLGTPANPPKFSRPGPGRPPGSVKPPRDRHPTHRKNTRRATKPRKKTRKIKPKG